LDADSALNKLSLLSLSSCCRKNLFYTSLCLLYQRCHAVTIMTFIPLHALENLKKYQYKGTDKCGFDLFMCIYPTIEGSVVLQIPAFALRPKSVLELACHFVADMGGS
jgi:hypothetical protein